MLGTDYTILSDEHGASDLEQLKAAMLNIMVNFVGGKSCSTSHIPKKTALQDVIFQVAAEGSCVVDVQV